MFNLSFTISKKLFLFFLVNSLIILMISGLVLNSFTGLSDQFNYNSQLLNYKIILDAIRVEQAKLKGMTQSFYLNVTEDSVREGIKNITNSTDMILSYLNELNDEKNQSINGLQLESQYRFPWNDQINQESDSKWDGIDMVIQRGFIYDFEKEKMGLNTNEKSKNRFCGGCVVCCCGLPNDWAAFVADDASAI